MSTSRNFCRAFTLVELLVVVSVIAILIAMLLPALAGAKEAGRRAACLSNLRQIAIAAINYGADTGEYPQAVQAKQQGGPLWIRDWVGNVFTNYGASPTATAGGVWSCPSQPRFGYVAATPTTHATYNTSYSYIAQGDINHIDNDPTATLGANGWASTVGGYPLAAKYRDDRNNPSTRIIASDRLTYAGAFYNATGRWALNHGSSSATTYTLDVSNTVYGDGHALGQKLGGSLPATLNRSTTTGNWRYNSYLSSTPPNAEVLFWW